MDYRRRKQDKYLRTFVGQDFFDKTPTAKKDKGDCIKLKKNFYIAKETNNSE